MALHGDAEADAERNCQDEAVAAREASGRLHHARDEDGRPELEDDAAHDADRDRGEQCAKLANDAEEDEPEGAREAGRAARAARERDQPVVLREGCVGRRAEARRKEGVDAVGKQAALHARGDLVLVGNLGELGGHGDVADSLGGRDHESDEDGQEVLGREGDRECLLLPREREPRRRVGAARIGALEVVLAEIALPLGGHADAGAIDDRAARVVGHRLAARGDGAAEAQAPNEVRRLDERRAEHLAQDGEADDGEGEADVLRRPEAEDDVAVVVLAHLWADCAERQRRVAQEAVAV
mmetsp:Transcript_95/g.303  ORF Transcript_95/g.303 Transcript_95/m.303 type:complete len:297 (+) Transcript_95:652-1542(+)